MPEFTIIIPHKNVPDLLVRCLDSIPDIEDIQLIVVDDDSSSDIVDFENFPGKGRQYTQIVFNKESKGAGHARNLGLPYVKGKWLLLADADDFFVDGFYSIISKYRESDADLIIFTPKAVMSDNLNFESDRAGYLIRHLERHANGLVSVRDVAARFVVPWSKMIRMSLVNEKSISFDETPSHNDVLFSTRVACLSRDIIIVDETIYIAMQRSASLSSAWKYSPEKLLVGLTVYIRANRLLKQNNLIPRPLAGFLYYGWRIGFFTFLKILWLLIDSCMLFSGLNYLLKDKELKSYALKKLAKGNEW